MALPAGTPSTPSRPSTHAYAIVSTSSALLSRSNSSNSSLNRHSFSPTHDYQRHRHSKSLNSADTPLPTPPSTVRVKPFRSRSATETDSSGLSDTGSDWAPETDPVLYDLRNRLLPVTLEEWSSIQLANCLRSRGKERLAQIVTKYQIAGLDLVKLNQSFDNISGTLANLSIDDNDQLTLECRKLQLLLRARRDFRSRTSSFSQSEESGLEDGPTPKTMSRIRVKKMVAAIESEPSPAILHSRPLSFPAIDPHNTFTPIAETTPRKYPEAGMPPATDDCPQNNQVLPKSRHEALLELEMGAEEPSIGALLQSCQCADSNDSNIFGAEAWEQDSFGATARKFKPPEHPKIIEQEESESAKMKLADIFPVEPIDFDSFSTEITTSPLLESETMLANGANPESTVVKELRKRITELEDRIKSMETDNNPATPYTEQPDDNELPQYLVIAGVGICAIVGQSILKRLFWSQG